MHKLRLLRTLACCDRIVLCLLRRKEVPKVMLLSIPPFRNAQGTSASPVLKKEKCYLPMRATLQKYNCHYRSLVTNPFDSKTVFAFPSNEEVALNRKIMLTMTVQGQLELYSSVQEVVNVVSKVAFLFNIAKIVERDVTQQEVLEYEREQSKEGKNTAYGNLLEGIAETIDSCQCRHLANIMWALGKIKDKDNNLIQVCKHEILRRDIFSFNFAEICQIVNGCTNLKVKEPELFANFQEAILSEKFNREELKDRHISGILMSYAKANSGSNELFDFFLREVASRNMVVSNRTLADIVWSFAKKGINSASMFSLVEAEIIRRGGHSFENVDLVKILWAFSRGDKGNIKLFYLLDSELVSRGLHTFRNVELVEVLWSFARRNVRNAKAFNVAETEILKRGVSGFKTHELVLILYSFVRVKRDSVSVDFIKNIEADLCLRNTNEFDLGHLGQMIWSLGRLNMSESNLFDTAEAELLKCSMHSISRAGKLMLIRGFIKAQRGSKELYQHLYSSISAKDLSNLTEAQICEFVWCFSLAKVDAGKLFDFLEKEILHREKYHFTKRQLNVIMKSFLRVGKGSKELLNFLTEC